MKSLAKEKYRSELKRVDWDFTGENGTAGFAAYHWYPARFVPQLAGILINYFSEPGDLVLDPFCGSGTTLVEAYRSGRLAVGIDLNYVAVIMTRAKLVNFDERGFAGFVDRVNKQATSFYKDMLVEQAAALFSENKSKASLKEVMPNYGENIGWYHPDTLRQIASLWRAVNQESQSKYHEVGLAAFSAILRYCCSQEKHWGWICDNVKPKDLTYKNALSKFSEKLREYKLSATELHQDAKELQEAEVRPSDIKVMHGDCIDILEDYPDAHFDLVVTSPPYYNMTDYVSSQRLSNLWLVANGDNLREKEIGARYKRFRKNSLDEYLTGIKDSFSSISRVLKRGKFCCVVIGESPRHKPYLDRFAAVCEELDLTLCDSLSRKVAEKRSLTPSLHHERIFILRKG
jgi:DNA modification methylase